MPSHHAPSQDLIDVRVAHIARVAHNIKLYQLEELQGARLPNFEPGAHVDVHLPNGMIRQYSMIESTPQPSRYAVAIKRDAVGRGGSRWAHDELRVGTTLRISAPRNNFALTEDVAEVILIAGGIGITPIWCMIQHLQQNGRPWRLHYACRSRDEMAFREELAALTAAHLHFDDESGRLIDVAMIVAAAPPEAHLYCCGPAPMLAAFERAAAERPRERIHVEHFTTTQEPAREGGFVVELARSQREFFVPAGRSILEVLCEAGIEVAFSCEQGICGTCETRVIAGIPDHRDSILTDQERVSNKTVMICCAGSKTERLVLDL